MRDKKESKGFRDSLAKKLSRDCDHSSSLSAKKTGDASYSMCPCKEEWVVQSLAYESCVPQKFWNSKRSDVVHNTAVFDGVIQKFMTPGGLRTAIDGGGLLLHGPNGVGKTMFLSMIVMNAIRTTGLSCYYTTALALNENLKRNFGGGAASQERSERLHNLLKSNILVLDEFSKERLTNADSWWRQKLEYILKERENDRCITLLASNRSPAEIRLPVEQGGYGESFGSMLDGGYLSVPMTPGDQRVAVGKNMNKKMGY